MEEMYPGAISNVFATVRIWLLLRKTNPASMNENFYSKVIKDYESSCFTLFGTVSALSEIETDVSTLDLLSRAIQAWIDQFGGSCGKAAQNKRYAQELNRRIAELKTKKRREKAEKDKLVRLKREEERKRAEAFKSARAKEKRERKEAEKKRQKKAIDDGVRSIEGALFKAEKNERVTIKCDREVVEFRAPPKGWLSVRLFHTAHQLDTADQTDFARELGKRLLARIEQENG